uniref:Cerebellin 10 n=1 Tax=Cyprinus carpio TaxID=7962 RepID=A0A8C2GNB0_CYPCA
MMKMEVSIVLLLCVGATLAQDFMSPTLDILAEFKKIKTMEEKLNRERTFTNPKILNNRVNLIKFFKNLINKFVLASNVAFSASLFTSFRSHNIGPFFNGLHTLIYKYVFLNTGNAYDPNTGIFTAPVRGAYAFRVFSKASGHINRAVTAGLFKNDQHIISTHGHQASGFISSSNGVSLLLEEGGKVKVNLYPGQWIFDNGEHHHSTFSGHLLFPM